MDTSDTLLWSRKVFGDEDEREFTPEFTRSLPERRSRCWRAAAGP
jgi:hypothetical protein